MNGSTAKTLRQAAKIRYREMIANKEINQPESVEHMRHQQRALYQGAKRAYMSLSSAARVKWLRELKKSLIRSRELKRNLRDSRQSGHA